MPMVNGKKYAYTPAGKAAAAAEKKKKPDPALGYTKSAQDKDRQAVKEYYSKKYNPVIDKARDERSQVGNYLNAEVQDRTSDTIRDAARSRDAGIAYQNSWIAKGAKANAIALAKKNKKKINKEAGWEDLTGMSRAQKIAKLREAGVSEDAIKNALGE